MLTAAMFCVFVAPQSACAFDLFGIHLWGKKKDPAIGIIGVPKYYDVDILLAPHSDEAGLKLVKASSALVADHKKPVSGSAGLLNKARSDYRLILAALYADGRYGGTISITINGHEAANIPADSELPERSTIIITINCGPQYKFRTAAIHDLAPLNINNSVPPPQEIGYASDKLAKSGVILKAEQLALTGWQNQGYAKAEVFSRRVTADHRLQTVDADIEINSGRLAHYGPLTVKNVTKIPRMDSGYVAWMTGLKEGERYNPEDLKKANKRLEKLQVFRAAVIHEADKIEPDGRLPLGLTLQERPPRRFGFGGNYSTLDGVGAEAYWMHRNLFGHAEKLRFDAKISGIGGSQDDSYNPQNFSYLLGTTYTRPGIITPDTDYVASLYGEREVLDNYTTTSLKGQTGFTHTFNDQLSGRLYLNAAQTRSKDNYFGSRDFTTLGFLGGLLYDSRDDNANAHRGVYGEAILEPIYETHFGHFIGKMTLEGRTYWELGGDNRFVLANRLKIGSITGADARELPSNLLFFAGGGGSVRGYGYKNIGVKTDTGDTIGGRSLVEASSELRSMITDTIGVVAFVDAGVVGQDSYPDFAQNTKVGAGLGGRYLTSLGPLRLDLAVPLNGESGDPNLGFYIGIGQAF